MQTFHFHDPPTCTPCSLKPYYCWFPMIRDASAIVLFLIFLCSSHVVVTVPVFIVLRGLAGGTENPLELGEADFWILAFPCCCGCLSFRFVSFR